MKHLKCLKCKKKLSGFYVKFSYCFLGETEEETYIFCEDCFGEKRDSDLFDTQKKPQTFKYTAIIQSIDKKAGKREINSFFSSKPVECQNEAIKLWFASKNNF